MHLAPRSACQTGQLRSKTSLACQSTNEGQRPLTDHLTTVQHVVDHRNALTTWPECVILVADVCYVLYVRCTTCAPRRVIE